MKKGFIYKIYDRSFKLIRVLTPLRVWHRLLVFRNRYRKPVFYEDTTLDSRIIHIKIMDLEKFCQCDVLHSLNFYEFLLIDETTCKLLQLWSCVLLPRQTIRPFVFLFNLIVWEIKTRLISNRNQSVSKCSTFKQQLQQGY